MSRGRLASRASLRAASLQPCRTYQPRFQSATPRTLHHQYELDDQRTSWNSRRNFSYCRSEHNWGAETSVAAAATVAVADDVPQYNFSIRPRDASAIGKGIENTSTIRASLKEWSVQNAVEKSQNTSQELPTTGRISEIPSALFVGRRASRSDEVDGSLYEGQDQLDSDVESVAGNVIVVRPGTLITYTAPSVSGNQLAVYMGNIGDQQLLALADGNWILDTSRVQLQGTATSKSYFNVPDFLDQGEMDHLKQYMPKETIKRPTLSARVHADVSVKGPMPAHAIRHFTAKVKKFQDEVDFFKREFFDAVETSYQKVAYPYHYRYLSLSEYVELGLGLHHDDLGGAAKMAIASLVANINTITFAPAGRSVSAFVMPTQLSDELAKVAHWARQYQEAAAKAAVGGDVISLLKDNPLTIFINKARRLILASRKLRAPTTTGTLGPSSVRSAEGLRGLSKVPSNETFTEEDLMIIDFLWTASFRKPAPDLLGYYKLGPLSALILRAVGAYPDLVLNDASTRLFLKELGCVDPWISPNHMSMDQHVSGGRTASVTRDLAKEYDKFEKEVLNSLTSDNLVEMDSMVKLRKDWGELPAFAIDKARGAVAEDAVSVEPAQHLPKGYWIHVHTSHLTAHFGPETIVGRYARNLGTSHFSVDKTMNTRLLPKQLAKIFHLKSGSPVITISTLVGDTGAVHDVKVTPGTLKHVVHIPRAAYYHLLGNTEEQAQHFSVLSVGENPGSSQEAISDHEIALARKYEDQLLQLNRVLQRHVRHQVENWSSSSPVAGYTFELETQVKDVPPLYEHREHEPFFWHGDPTITVTSRHVLPSKTAVSRSDDPVTQAMRLAAGSAGRWLTQRNIPAIFLGNFSPKQAYSSVDHPMSVPNSRWMQTRHTRALAMQKYHVAEYACWTSPLRRYIDMVAHYQTDSYLKAEASGLILPGAPLKDDSLLAFTEANLQEYLDGDANNIDKFAETAKRVSTYYGILGLFRAFHFREAQLPHEWEVLVIHPFRYDVTGSQRPASGGLIPFGLPCLLTPSKEGFEKAAAPQMFVKVKIDRVDPERQVVECTAIAPPTMEQTLRNPIQTLTDSRIEVSETSTLQDDSGDTKTSI